MDPIQSVCRARRRAGREALAFRIGILSLALPLLGLTSLSSGCATVPKAGVPAKGPQAPAGAVIALESLDLTAVEQMWGQAQAGKSIDGQPLIIAGEEFANGFGTHARSEMIIQLFGSAVEFRAQVGVDGEVKERGSVVFVILVDDEEAARSSVLHGNDPAEPIHVDLTGAKELMLVVEDAGDGVGHDHADWVNAEIVLKPGAKRKPVAVVMLPGPDPVISMVRSPQPEIHAPRVTGATPGCAFLFRIPASGKRPMRFVAEGLPAGLTLDSETGIISGVLEEAGETDVKLAAANNHGLATSTLTIVGGHHKLALTPPMGWNSWNVWGTSVDQDKVQAAAESMVKSGLADYGYMYINIDDAWEAERDEEGVLQPNDKFPDMHALAEFCHARGLKLGIYSSPGPKTCGGYVGSYEHEYLDAQTWADWGIDLVKYDWCSYRRIAKDDSRAEMRKPYELMRDALDECGRDIVFSMCQYGMDSVWEWGADVGGNYWRTTGDIVDSWLSMSCIGFGQASLAEYAGPGHWNDPDMLVVGKVGWGPDLHPSRLTKNEQVTHITLWSLLASPLLIGCDMSDLDDFTLAILTNPEVLDVNQDPLGRQATRVWKDRDHEVWARPLIDGTLAVGLFNRGRKTEPVTARWEDLGLSGAQPVRDLWQRKDLGTFDGSFSATVSNHGALMLKIGQPTAP